MVHLCLTPGPTSGVGSKLYAQMATPMRTTRAEARQVLKGIQLIRENNLVTQNVGVIHGTFVTGFFVVNFQLVRSESLQFSGIKQNLFYL